MSIIEQFKKGDISISELRDMAAKDPSLRMEIAAMLDIELTELELQDIAAAGTAGPGRDYHEPGLYVEGTSGDDRIVGSSQGDHLDGNDGNDRLYGDSGDDDMSGGRGNDRLDGGSGDDVIDGGQGNDSIMGGTGNDTLTGGSGSDIFRFRDGDGDDVITDFTSGEDLIQIRDSVGEGYSVTYDAESGNTYISYSRGTITVEGQIDEGDIQYIGLASDGNDEISTDSGDDGVNGRGGDDRINTGAGNDIAIGGDGNDTVDGGAGNDTVTGDGGDDHLSGGSGDDYILGGYGDDVIDGGEGDDSIRGGVGDDVLTGGSGSDVFYFGPDDGDDVITDFTPGEDVLSLDGVLSMDDFTVEIVGGNTVISFGSATVTLEGREMSAEEVWSSVARG